MPTQTDGIDMALPNRRPDAMTVSQSLGGLSVLLATLAMVALLFPQPLADAFFAAWVLVAVGLAVVGALGAWTGRTVLVWIAALLLVGLTVVGMWSLGLFFAPAALALLGAAVASLSTGPRPDAYEDVRSDPPSVLDAVLKTLGGTVAVIVGIGLVYEGTVVRELFARGCASETLTCALAVTRWDAVGLSALGLAAVGVGGWLIWKQVAVGRVLASNQVG